MANIGIIQGTFIYNGKPQNGAVAKLWQIYGFFEATDSTDEVEDNPMTDSQLTLDVNDGGLFAVDDIIKIQDEILLITAISNNTLTVQRAYHESTAAEHVQNTTIYDWTFATPAQDAAEPAVGYQQGSNVTTGVTYGGDGAFLWSAVPAGKYYVSCYYDTHRAWFFIGEPTLESVLKVRGDIPFKGVDEIEALAKGTEGHYLKQGANEPEWAALTIVGYAKIASGNYTGNAAANKPIAHGLGITPKIVFIMISTGNNAYQWRIFGAIARIVRISQDDYAVTIPNATNFYVGDGTNHAQTANAVATYYWVAIG